MPVTLTDVWYEEPFSVIFIVQRSPRFFGAVPVKNTNFAFIIQFNTCKKSKGNSGKATIGNLDTLSTMPLSSLLHRPLS